MSEFVPVDHDPFAGGPQFVPVDHDPFAAQGGVMDYIKDKFNNPPGMMEEPSLIGMAGNAWRTLKSGATLPGQVWRGEVDPHSEEGMNRTMDLASIATPISPASRLAGAAVPPAIAPPAAEVPTAMELKAAAQAGYKAPEVAAVEIKPAAVTNLAASIENDLLQRGFRPTAKSAGDTFGEIRDLRVPSGVESVKVADLDTARQALGNLSREVDAIGQPTAEAAAAGRAISKIDEFLPNLSQSDLLAGDAQKANSILQEARANYKAYKQSSLVDTKQGNAELQAASTYGGGNINNATRQAFRPLLKNNEAGLSGFSPAASAQANQVVKGGALGNTMRQLGRLAPTGPVNMGIHVGAALGTGGATIPVAIGAYAAKKIGEGITRSEVQKLNDIIRRQSPLYASRIGQNAAGMALLPARATQPTRLPPALLRALLLSSSQPAPIFASRR